jgi:hypothetical protein
MIFGRGNQSTESKPAIVACLISLSSWDWVLVEMLLVSQLFSNFSTFYGTHKVYCLTQKDASLDPILGCINPVHSISWYL